MNVISIVKRLGIYCDASDSNIVINKSNITSDGIAINIQKKCNCEIIETTINITGNSKIIQCEKVNVDITIKDSNLKNEDSKSETQGIDINGGTLNIKGTTTIKSAGAAIYSNEDANTIVNIESGTIESTASQAIVMNKATGIINVGIKDKKVDEEFPILKSAVSDWTIRSDMMKLNFYDGKLIGGKYKIIGASIEELEDEYNLVSSINTDDSGNEFEILKLGKAESEAQIVGNSSKPEGIYSTLKEAVENANTESSGQPITIKLLKDVYQAQQIRIEKGQNIKIDLNGHKFFAMTDKALYNEGKLEIIDSVTTAEDEYNLVGSTGAVIIHNALTENEGDTSVKGELILGQGTKINYTASGVSNQYKNVIENDGLLKTTNNEAINVSGDFIHVIENNGIFELNGSKITTSGNNTYAVYNNNTNETDKSTMTDVNISMTGINNSYGVYNNNNGTIEIGGTTQITSTQSAITNNSTGNIIIKGGTILSSGRYGINNVDEGIIQIDDGKIEAQTASYECIRNYNGGTVNIANGEITSKGLGIYNYNYKKSGTINIKGGIIKSTTNHGIQNGNSNEGTVNITGGNIISESKYGVYNNVGILNLGNKLKEGEEDTVDTKNPSITGGTNGVYNNSTFNFYDGAITGPIKKSIFGAITDYEVGYQIIKTQNEDETTETATLQQVNIAELKKETDTGEESIEIFKNVEKLQAKLKELDTKQKYKIKVLADFSIKNTERIEIPNELTVTIDLNGFSATTAVNPAIKNNGKLTIMDSSEDSSGNIMSELNGTSDSYCSIIYNEDNANLNIASGNIILRGKYEYGIYNSDTGTVIVNGGKIDLSGSYEYGIQNKGKLELKGNTMTVNDSNSYAIYNNTSSENTVKIKGSTISNTKGEGIYNKGSGVIEIGKLENIEASDEQTIITKINTSSNAIYNNDDGRIVIDGAEIVVTSSSSIENNGKGTIELKNGKISTTSTLKGSHGINNYNGGTINIIDGEVISNGGNAICNYNYRESGIINIQGGKITSSGSYAIYNTKSNETGTVNITGGTIESNSSYGVYNYTGTLNIGKKIEDTETTLEDIPNENSPIIKGKTYGVYSNETFNYYDGIISGAVGKSINENITDIRKNYQVEKTVQSDVETATLKKIEIMQINGKSYQTINEAQSEINNFSGTDEHVIKLLNDTYMSKLDTISIPADAKVKLDLNSYTLETSSDTAIDNNGNLTITDESETKTGKILGTAKTIIDNKNELVIDGVELKAINYVSVIDSTNRTKIVNNTKKLTWKNSNLLIDIGSSYGIYNLGEGTINWNSGNIFLNASTHTNRQYGIYVEGTGNIDIENVKFKTIGITNNNQYSGQYFIYSKNTNNIKTKIDIKNFSIDETSNKNGHRYGIYGENLNLNILGGIFEGLNSGDIELKNSQILITGGTLNDTIIIPDNTTATINGSEVTINRIENSGTLQIEDGTIKNVNSKSSTSNITMSNGNIYNTENNAVEITSGTFTLKGGKIESTNGYGVYINGSNGTFIMGENDKILSTDIPKVIGSTYGVYSKSGTFNFYDGVVQGAEKAIYGVVNDTPESYKVKIEEDGKKAILGVISEKENIVSVGNMYFNNMKSAMEQANRVSGIIEVYNDLDLDDSLTIDENSNVTINLNGHNLTASISGSLFINKGDLTIIDKVKNNDSSTNTVGSKVENTLGYAITNNGTLTIGIQDGQIDKVTPHIKGKINAIQNNGTVYWYDGRINDQTTDQEKKMTSEISNIKREIQASAEKILDELQQTLKIAGVQSPIIKVDKELPIWTNQPVTATIYTPSRIVLNIVNNNENAQVQSIVAKKVWKMPEEEAENYRVTIQLMKKKDEEIVPALDKQEKEITVRIIGNGTQTFDNVPIYEGENKIEYVLKEIKVEKRTSRDDEDWQELPLNEFSVTYEDE